MLPTRDEMEKCGLTNVYMAKITSTRGIMLDDENKKRPLVGDMTGFITRDGRLIMMKSPSDKNYQSISCDVSLSELVSIPWGKFHDESLEDKKLTGTTILVLKQVRKRIRIDESLNESFRHV